MGRSDQEPGGPFRASDGENAGSGGARNGLRVGWNRRQRKRVCARPDERGGVGVSEAGNLPTDGLIELEFRRGFEEDFTLPSGLTGGLIPVEGLFLGGGTSR